MRGLLAYSFGVSPTEPNSSNRQLAEAIMRIAREESVAIVAQSEVAKALGEHCFVIGVVRENLAEPGAYLDSEEVTRQAGEMFKRREITEVIPVAHPFLHLTKCRELLKKAGFTVIDRPIGNIGFPKDSLQWWTRGRLRLILYALLQVLFGFHGRPVHKP